jgi:hypothetical protein
MKGSEHSPFSILTSQFLIELFILWITQFILRLRRPQSPIF